jgi:signal peptidase II
MVIILLAIVLMAVLDQLIKWQVIEHLKGMPSKDFLKIGDFKIMDLTYLENDGAVFGSFSGMTTFLSIITIVFIGVCVFILYKYHKTSRFLSIALTLIVGGGVGNLIDRIFRHGRVVDYLEVKLFDFAIFNLADTFVVVGEILLLCFILFSPTFKKSISDNNPEEPPLPNADVISTDTGEKVE